MPVCSEALLKCISEEKALLKMVVTKQQLGCQGWDKKSFKWGGTMFESRSGFCVISPYNTVSLSENQHAFTGGN